MVKSLKLQELSSRYVPLKGDVFGPHNMTACGPPICRTPKATDMILGRWINGYRLGPATFLEKTLWNGIT